MLIYEEIVKNYCEKKKQLQEEKIVVRVAAKLNRTIDPSRGKFLDLFFFFSQPFF